jgi:ketosteroid isomerase-like protein
LTATLLFATVPDDEIAAVRKAVDEGNAEFAVAFKTANAELLAAQFDEDGAMISGRRIQGRRRILEVMTEVMAQRGPYVDFRIETLCVWIDGEFAYEPGKYTAVRKGPDGNLVETSGFYMEIWRKQPDGTWKMFRDAGLPKGTSPEEGGQAESEADEEQTSAIRQGNTVYVESLKKADAELYASCFDAEAEILHVRDCIRIAGKDKIVAVRKAMFARSGPMDLTLETTGLWAEQEELFETGLYSYSRKNPDGSETKGSGKYFFIWKQQPDGDWKILKDIDIPD